MITLQWWIPVYFYKSSRYNIWQFRLLVDVSVRRLVYRPCLRFVVWVKGHELYRSARDLVSLVFATSRLRLWVIWSLVFVLDYTNLHDILKISIIFFSHALSSRIKVSGKPNPRYKTNRVLSTDIYLYRILWSSPIFDTNFDLVTRVGIYIVIFVIPWILKACSLQIKGTNWLKKDMWDCPCLNCLIQL